MYIKGSDGLVFVGLLRKMFRFLSVVWKIEMSGKQTWKREKGRRNFSF